VSEVTIAIIADTTEAFQQIDNLQGKIDATVADWKAQRAIIISQIQEIGRGIQYVIRGLRLAAQATGQTLSPMQNALLALIGSTASMIISTAIAIEVGSLGVLTGVALGLAAFAYGMELAQTARIIAEFADLKDSVASVDNRLATIARSQMGGGGIF
jgi:hypothetical protein